MTDIAVLDALMRAQDGDFGGLADLIERGISLDEPTRMFLATYLRGKIVRPRGQRRTLSAREQDTKALLMVRHLGRLEKMKAQMAAENGLKCPSSGHLARLAA